MSSTTFPLISVIVPTYNQAAYLPICLDSIMFQEYPDIEIVVVNDCSPDNTAEVLEQYLAAYREETVSYACNYNEADGTVERCEHPRFPQDGRTIKIIEHKRNRGLSHALNTGVKQATGELVTFIASDDMLLPNMLAELSQAIADSRADFAYADMHIVDDAGRILRRFSLPDYSFEDSFCHWYLLGICKLYRKRLHAVSGWYDPEVLPQDHDMYQRFAEDGARMVHVPKVLANARIHDKDRQVHNHSPAAWSKLYQQSADLVCRARVHARHLNEGEGRTREETAS